MLRSVVGALAFIVVRWCARRRGALTTSRAARLAAFAAAFAAVATAFFASACSSAVSSGATEGTLTLVDGDVVMTTSVDGGVTSPPGSRAGVIASSSSASLSFRACLLFFLFAFLRTALARFFFVVAFPFASFFASAAARANAKSTARAAAFTDALRRRLPTTTYVGCGSSAGSAVPALGAAGGSLSAMTTSPSTASFISVDGKTEAAGAAFFFPARVRGRLDRRGARSKGE